MSMARGEGGIRPRLATQNIRVRFPSRILIPMVTDTTVGTVFIGNTFISSPYAAMARKAVRPNVN